MKKKIKSLLLACALVFLTIPFAYTEDCSVYTEEWLDCVREGCGAQARLLILMDIADNC